MPLKEQRQQEHTNIIEEQYVNYSQLCQKSLELETGTSSVISFGDLFLVSVSLISS
jgi:hypothetical protein